MAATTVFRDTRFLGLAPSRGTSPVAANTYLVKGALVDVDASGNLVDGGTGVRTVGKMSANVDNRTGSEAGGGAGDIDGEYEYGVFMYACSDTPRFGDMMYAVDNQTVSNDSAGGTRPAVGPFTELRTINGSTQAGVYVGPLVSQSDVTAARSAIAVMPQALVQADGTPNVAFTDGVVDGFVVSEGIMHRFNVASTDAMRFSVSLPQDLDASKDVTIHALVSREGTADTDVVLTYTAFFQPAGAAYDADADAGGNSDALSAAATKVVQELVATIDAADVPTGPCNLSLSVVPSAALDTDDLNIHSLWVEFSRK